MSFEITTQPKKGSIELSDDGSFVYSPIDGKRGRIDLTIPTLMEYIEICKKYGKHCVLELKNEFKASDVYKIVSMIEKAGYLDHVIFISFALKNLISLRRRYPTSNVVAIDYDPGATRVNQENRIKLMLAVAREEAPLVLEKPMEAAISES